MKCVCGFIKFHSRHRKCNFRWKQKRKNQKTKTASGNANGTLRVVGEILCVFANFGCHNDECTIEQVLWGLTDKQSIVWTWSFNWCCGRAKGEQWWNENSCCLKRITSLVIQIGLFLSRGSDKAACSNFPLASLIFRFLVLPYWTWLRKIRWLAPLQWRRLWRRERHFYTSWMWHIVNERLMV